MLLFINFPVNGLACKKYLWQDVSKLVATDTQNQISYWQYRCQRPAA